ncbi:hypothetical protein [secondary endosymbiont of Ctenarytaina eucalypti]|uniref:hypothetical protein n=1 Tax=secondary endosymbiont of Ctenarytaina eucalypti TaxID=1199245 RepID=UPI0013571D14|nr:hypothetical protein [secondary endosymbiont of Ctenarytaina eucalypti]
MHLSVPINCRAVALVTRLMLDFRNHTPEHPTAPCRGGALFGQHHHYEYNDAGKHRPPSDDNSI